MQLSPSPQQAPSTSHVGALTVTSLIGLIADGTGFFLAATQNWTGAFVAGLVALLGGGTFLAVQSSSLSRKATLLVLVIAALGSGFTGAAIGHWITPPTVVVAKGESQPLPSSTTAPTLPTDTTPPSTSSAAPNSSTVLSTSSVAPDGQDPERMFLSELTPLNTNSVNTPKSLMIGTETYPKSFTLGCNTGGTSVTYPVAGYRLLEARIGLDNNQAGTAAKNGYKSVIRVTGDGNAQQLGTEYTVSLGHPADLSVPLNGAVQATISCTLIDPKGGNTAYYQVAFGNATISK